MGSSVCFSKWLGLLNSVVSSNREIFPIKFEKWFESSYRKIIIKTVSKQNKLGYLSTVLAIKVWYCYWNIPTTKDYTKNSEICPLNMESWYEKNETFDKSVAERMIYLTKRINCVETNNPNLIGYAQISSRWVEDLNVKNRISTF